MVTKKCPLTSDQDNVNYCINTSCQWWSYAIDNCIIHMLKNLTMATQDSKSIKL